MLLRSPRTQRGQALLLVLVFVAAFLVLSWAGLTLAASSFLDLSSVQADTRTTEALDAGLAYGMEAFRFNGAPCTLPVIPGALSLAYPSGTITVNVTVARVLPCNAATPSFQFHASSPSTTHSLDARVTRTGGVMVITWERFN
jgi:hypothetical protein